MHALSSHLSATFTRTSSNFRTSSSFADLSIFPSLICDFCPSDQEFAYSFLQIPPHDGHPCCSAIHFPLPGHVQDFHLRERAHGAQTKRAPQGAHEKTGSHFRDRQLSYVSTNIAFSASSYSSSEYFVRIFSFVNPSKIIFSIASILIACSPRCIPCCIPF